MFISIVRQLLVASLSSSILLAQRIPEGAPTTPPKSESEAFRDRLLDVDLESPRFTSMLHRRLVRTAFDCGRVIVDPGPEYSISIYSRKAKKSRIFWVTYLANDKCLRDVTDWAHYPERARLVKTSRIDRQIPENTALRLRTVWTLMLTGRQAPRPLRADDLITTDGIYAEFAIPLANGKTPVGVWMYTGGVKAHTFFELSQDLLAYCKAKPANRTRLLHRIDVRTNGLLRRLQ